MGTSIRLKKSAVADNAPSTSEIDYGELAINYADGKLYYKTSSNAIDFFTAGSGDSTLLDGVTAGTVTASKAVIVDSNKDITGFRNVTTTGNTTLGDGVGDALTINAATIALANVAAGTDNTVLVYNGSTVLTDEIDSRVWGSTLVDGSGTTNYITKWSDSNTVTDSVITDDGSTVTIGGNLTVNGTTTTLNATNSVVTDNLFELNSGVTSNANDSGIIIERGSTGNNALFIWDESADKFALGTTTATADSTGNISYTDAGLIAGSLDISGEFRVNGGGTGTIVVNDEDSSLCPTMTFLRNGGGTSTNDFIKFENSGGEVAAINAVGGGYFSGNVGIGTTTPANTLDVNGSLKINGEIVEKTANTTGVTGSTALDPANGTVQRLVFSGNVTFTDSLADGESITLHIDDGSGNVVSAWPTITWATGSAPTLNTGTDTIVAVWKVNSTLYGATVGTSQDVVSDTTPQLGGNLDVNGKDIVSVSNGDIELAPNGSGVVIFKGDATKGSGQFKLNCENNTHGITIKGPPHSATASYTLVLPNDDGDASQVLTTNGSGTLSWSTPSGSYGDSNVDTHLNQSAAGSNEVLSWSGSDYAWVANSGTSGGTSGTSERIVSIDAGALVPRTTNGAATASEEYATNDVMSDHFLFDGSTEEGVQFRFHMPSDWDGNAVNAKFYWDGATGASASDGVTWGIAMQAFQNDDALDNAYGTSVDTDDALIAVGDLHVTAESADITIAGSPSAGDLIFAEVTRVVADSNDTMTEDAKLIGVTIHYNASVSSQVSINIQTGTTYTTVLTDASKLVTLNNGSAITLTIPPNSSVAYPIGTKIDLLQIGAGQVTVAGGAGVTVHSTPTLKLRAQYSGGTCIQYAANTWIFAGDLAAS